MLVFIFFLSYKYLYLEQSIYLLTNKLSKLEIEYNNPNIYSNQSNSNIMKTAEIIMNEIFTDDDNNSCSIKSNICNSIIVNDNVCANDNVNGNGNVNGNANDNGNVNANGNGNANGNDKNNKTSIIQPIHTDEVQIINELFDLKKDIDDKESIISGTTGGGGIATKKALMKLSIDKLKSKCEDRKLSTEGTKNQLADRIIVHDNSIEITDINDE
jgi:hypothetical protein